MLFFRSKTMVINYNIAEHRRNILIDIIVYFIGCIKHNQPHLLHYKFYHRLVGF